MRKRILILICLLIFALPITQNTQAIIVKASRDFVSVSNTASYQTAESTISVNIGRNTVNFNETFTIDVVITPSEPIAGAQCDLTFNPSLITIKSVIEGELFKSSPQGSYFLPGTIHNEEGYISGIVGVLLGKYSVDKKGIFASITATSKTTVGISPIDLLGVVVGNPEGKAIGASITNGVVKISDAFDRYIGTAIQETSPNYYEISYPGSGGKIGIGDAGKSTTFKPDLTISTWNNEASFTLISPYAINSKSQLTTSLAIDKITASNGEWQFEYKPTAPREGFNEKGGIDIFITAKEKPSSNQILFAYDSRNVTPYLQLELTEEEIKEGIHRPEYIVNSIAFYATEKSNYLQGAINYGTGKVGHLYRMLTEGQWCDWSIEYGLIILTMPQKVLDNAKYPLIISPTGDTFGYTTQGSSSSGASRAWAAPYTSPSNFGTISSISVCVSASSQTLSVGIYSDSSGSPLTRLGYGTGTTVTTKNFYSCSFSYAGAPSTAYWLGHAVSDDWAYYWDAGTLTNKSHNVGYTLPATWAVDTTNQRLISVYCTYIGISYSLTNSPSSQAFNIVSPSTTYYAKGAVPANPVVDENCTFTITNDGSVTAKITIQSTDFTNYALGTPDATHVRLTAYATGDNPASGPVLTGSPQTLVASLTASSTKMWDFKLETITVYSSQGLQTATITLTAVAP